jgi:hypothetical protein
MVRSILHQARLKAKRGVETPKQPHFPRATRGIQQFLPAGVNSHPAIAHAGCVRRARPPEPSCVQVCKSLQILDRLWPDGAVEPCVPPSNSSVSAFRRSTVVITLVQIDLNFLNWAACAGNTVGWEREQREWSVWLGCDYGRTMRVWMLLPSSLNSVRRKSKNPRESGRPELRSRASRKTKTSAFKASLSRRWVSPISRPSSS